MKKYPISHLIVWSIWTLACLAMMVSGSVTAFLSTSFVGWFSFIVLSSGTVAVLVGAVMLYFLRERIREYNG